MNPMNREDEKINVWGARVHNLKNVDVEIPRNSLTVITGLSGSGKSSLAFDTKMPLAMSPSIRHQPTDNQEEKTESAQKDSNNQTVYCPLINCHEPKLILPPLADDFQAVGVSLESHTGIVVLRQSVVDNEVDVSGLPNGSYVMFVENSRGASHRAAYVQVRRCQKGCSRKQNP